MLTNPPRLGMLERYPAVPSPLTVEVSCVARYEVLTRLTRFAVEINPPRLGMLER